MTEQQREKRRAYSKAYYEANKEYFIEYRLTHIDHHRAIGREYSANHKDELATYYRDNREHILKQAAEYRKANKDKIKERDLKYRRNNSQKISEYWKSHRLLNPEQWGAYSRNYKARKRDATGTHSASDITALYAKQGHKCAACCSSISDRPRSKTRFEVDHVIALANGGSNGPENLQLLCGPCNRKKRDMDDLQWANNHGRLFS